MPPAPVPLPAFRVVGAHTDSPNLRIKPNPDHVKAGWQMLGVEVYGGPLLNSWLDRDLGLAGRVAVRGADGVEPRLFHDATPLLRVAQLAIHLDREPERRARPSTGSSTSCRSGASATGPGDVRRYLAEQVERRPRRTCSRWDVMTHPVRALAPASVASASSSPRPGWTTSRPRTPACGPCSTPWRPSPARMPGPRALRPRGGRQPRPSGARLSTLLPSVLERIVLAGGGDPRRLLAGARRDGDRLGRHGPRHPPQLRRPARAAAPDPRQRRSGPQGQHQPALRDGLASARRRSASRASRPACRCRRSSTRSDLPCGSTVGPVTSSLTGATTVDFGAPLLSMHSARELMGAEDPALYAAALAAFLAPA